MYKILLAIGSLFLLNGEPVLNDTHKVRVSKTVKVKETKWK